MWKRRKRIAILSYFVIYLVFFYLIEHVFIHPHYHVLDSALDRAIPFVPVFVIPYYFWFVYHVFALLPPFTDSDPEEYYRTAFALFSGMTVFIITSIIFPNTQTLRPSVTGNDICSRLVRAIYAADTPTNIMPSIHVYNALIANTAICRRALKKRRAPVCAVSIICCALIILSTLFIKQHTVYDVLGAVVMYLVFYTVFFRHWHMPACLAETAAKCS